MLKNLIYKLGADPHRSWASFKTGLGIFVAGVVLLLTGAAYWMWLQIPGVVCMVIGFFFVARGYVGIFANRFAQTLNRMPSKPSPWDKQP